MIIFVYKMNVYILIFSKFLLIVFYFLKNYIFNPRDTLMDEITEYLQNLDISILSANIKTLKTVLINIKPFITKLSNSKNTTDKIQEILSLSHKEMLIEQLKNIKIDSMIYNGCGSKVLEIFIEKDLGHILYLFVNKNVKKVLNDEYGTFVLRKMIAKNYFIILKLDDIDFEKEYVCNTINVFLSKEFVFENKDKKVVEKVLKSKRIIIDYIIDNYINIETLDDKKYSFFIENFIKSIQSDDINLIYRKIKRNIKFLSESKYGNFIIQSLIEKIENVEKIIQKIDFFVVHENILLKTLSKLQFEQKHELVEKLIIKHYKNLKNFIFTNDYINEKSLNIVKRLFILDKHNLNVNTIFAQNFSSKCFKGDIECLKLYLMGNDSPNHKEILVKRIMNDCWGKKGEKALVWMSRCCSFNTREIILKKLRRKKAISS